MARDLKPNGEGAANPEHNVADLKKLINECADGMTTIQKARADLNEDAGDIRKRLRDAGVEVKAFDAALRIRHMEAEARAQYTDSLQLAYEALSVGDQGSLLLGDEEPSPTGNQESDDYSRGFVAGEAGTGLSGCTLEGDRLATYTDGWHAGQAKRVDEMAKPKGRRGAAA